ncbi:zinc metallopeptidase [Pontibacillus halophilus JSM 076056 = DSM 19796]|uniref:Zinc metallopeptidase n=1 Tax=Pontibacillus halophilus JSM 076056 = DSM 19796 TaxID=1385510 RepID=A0A0A5GLP2_9BACI|nr:zinc metallopeptidase [Pontibacillus halophilus]KGX92148.1 zinc metallopeptidase [Pontibacillus halophilus JSM 076056 = DSM 19796]
MEFLIYFALILIIPLWAQGRVKSTYKKYSKVANSSGLTGAEVARKILDDHGLQHVQVGEVRGTLSDHYNPRTKVVNLSSDNYHRATTAGQAVAAHEVGHAIQDQQEYAFLKFRSALAPVASIGSNASIFLIIGGALLGAMQLYLLGIIFMAFGVLFNLVTLPVEFDASNRAMDQLVSSGIIRSNEEKETKKVLNAAALTYVAAALVALLELLRFVLLFTQMNGDD